MAAYAHNFANQLLEKLALTHASTGRDEDNERLEFLGDAVLDLIVAEELYRRDPTRDEGAMTEHKAWVVSREILAAAARDLGLEKRAHFGHGMHARRTPPSVLANLYEAMIGAIYLDAGLEPARSFALSTLADPLERVESLTETHSNPKQLLQRLAQLQTGEPPTYLLMEERGDAHAKAFLVAAEIDGTRYPSAWGRTRKEAERWAAHEALLLLDEEPSPATQNANGRQAPARAGERER